MTIQRFRRESQLLRDGDEYIVFKFEFEENAEYMKYLTDICSVPS